MTIADDHLEQTLRSVIDWNRPRCPIYNDLKNYYVEILKENRSSYPNVVYHYTSLEALAAILEKDCFHVSDITHVNDASEFKYTVDLLKDVISKRMSNHPFTRASKCVKSFFDQVSDLRSGGHIFIGSFSEEKDVLSQWRSYCPPYGGVSIGFKTDEIDCAAEKLSGQWFMLEKCIYEEKVHLKLINGLSSIFIKDLLDAEYKAPNEHTKGSRQDSSMRMFLKLLCEVAPTIKNKHFDEEKEWRLISRPMTSVVPEIKYKARNNNLIPYYEFNLGFSDPQNYLSEVVIGPHPSPKSMEHSVRSLLDHYRHVGVRIRHSKIPYITW